MAGTGISNQRPNVVGDWAGPTKIQYLNPSAFAAPAPGTFGDVGAYALFLPFWNNWDVALQKSFPITERVATSFRAEFFNFPNHLSYTGVSSTVGSSTFGQVNGATDPRTMEFALRISF